MIPDPRHITNGHTIPSEGYADQPYIVPTDDGAWLCVMTTGAGLEGDSGQHIVTMRSTDQGQTWEPPVAVEPSDGPEASYAVMLKVPTGRIYCFYNHNTDRVREVKREDGGVYTRVDSLGHYVFKFSDDHGRSWSAKRYDVPVREFACDRENVYGGSLRFFWNVGRPLLLEDCAIMMLHKVGAMGAGFFARSEGVFLRSVNILTEIDPEAIVFETLPDGDIGLRTPPGGGRVSEEQSVTRLSDGSLFCVYRCVDGWPVCAYSRDGWHTWTPPAYMTYQPGGRRVKHPRAANFVWRSENRCGNGRFLYWFHNHGGAKLGARPEEWAPYDYRNPVWLMAGREVASPPAPPLPQGEGSTASSPPGPPSSEEGGRTAASPPAPLPRGDGGTAAAEGAVIEWSQPEVLLYDDDPYIRMSYPDLVEEDGRFFVTETQKTIGRVHEIPAELLDGLFGQWERAEVAREGLALDVLADVPARLLMPRLPQFTARDSARADMGLKDFRAGFSIEAVVTLAHLGAGQVMLDSRTDSGQGLALVTTERGTLQIILNDGRTESRWDCDTGVVRAGEQHHVVVTVDGGPKIITFIVDGVLCDGGDERQFGWGRFCPLLQGANGGKELQCGQGVYRLRIYPRALRTSEAVGNYRAYANEVS